MADNAVVKITPKQFQLADVVSFGYNSWNVSIVKQIRDGQATLFRPYGHADDFSYTGGVICYVGIEEYSVSLESSMEYVLLERKSLK